MANLRAPLVIADSAFLGSPTARASIVTADSLTGGAPATRVSNVSANTLTGGSPSLRIGLISSEVLVSIPFGPEYEMPTLTFPQLLGLSFDLHKVPNFNTAIRGVTAGYENRTAYQKYPIWEFTLTYDWLDDTTTRSNGYTDLHTLAGFYLQAQGPFASWLYYDKDDYRVAGGKQATPDGVTTVFKLSRDFGGFIEPVGQLDQSTIATFPYTAVTTASSQITIAGHGLTTGAGPYFVSASGTLPSGIAAATPYWVIVVDANTLRLATSPANAAANSYITISTQGTGTNTIAKGWAIFQQQNGESHVVPGSPYQVTVTLAAGFIQDLGVTVGGTALTKVGSAPAAGQYAVSATGVYTFNSAQSGSTALISYVGSLAGNSSFALPNVVTATYAPPVGATLTGYFDFFFVCRFSDDKMDLDKFMDRLWELKTVSFKSVLQ